jgi:hypothetical protein
MLTFLAGTRSRLSADWFYVKLIWCWLRVERSQLLRQSPKRTLLSFIEWWQMYVTSPDGPMPDRCPRGEGSHCSLRGKQAVLKYGAIIGAVLVLWYMRQCRKDYGPKGAC